MKSTESKVILLATIFILTLYAKITYDVTQSTSKITDLSTILSEAIEYQPTPLTQMDKLLDRYVLSFNPNTKSALIKIPKQTALPSRAFPNTISELTMVPSQDAFLIQFKWK